MHFIQQAVFKTEPRLLKQKPPILAMKGIPSAAFSGQKNAGDDLQKTTPKTKFSWWDRLKSALKQCVFPVSLLGAAWGGGVLGTGAANPLMYGGTQPSELVAKAEIPQPHASQYAHGYLMFASGTGECSFYSSLTGNYMPMEPPSDAMLSQWFGVGESIVIQGNVLSSSESTTNRQHERKQIEIQALMPFSAFQHNPFVSFPVQTPPTQQMQGTVGYDRGSRQWLLIESQSNERYELMGVTPETLTQWMRPYAFVQIRFEMPPQTVSHQPGATAVPKGRILQINPM